MNSIGLNNKLESIESRLDLSEFIKDLRYDLMNNTNEWENKDLPAFLEAMESWIRDMDGFFINQKILLPENPTWKLFGQILLTSKMYE